MRARCFDFRLSVLSGVATGLLAFAVPAAATVTSGALAPATSLDDAWSGSRRLRDDSTPSL